MKPLIDSFRKSEYTKNEIVKALLLPDEASFKDFFELSEAVCEEHFGKGVFIRGIIEYTNKCRKNCCYCGIRRDNANVTRYAMKPGEIIKTAEKLLKQNIKTVVLQGGEDTSSDSMLLEVISELKSKHDMAVTISIGERPFDIYEKFKSAGADRFLLRIETTDPALFKALHPDDDLEYRKKCLYAIKKMGFQAGTGIMVGLPGQSVESIADDLLFFREYKPAMVGIGPFLPHKDTPLASEKPKELFLTLKTMALIRIILGRVNLPATTAMGTLSKDGRKLAMMYGANVFMPNYTPEPYRGEYLLYDNKICVSEDCSNLCAAGIIKSAGKFTAEGRGDVF